MTLRIELKPFEELRISRAVIQNGPDRISFAVSGNAPILREKDYLPETAVDTPCKELQFAIQTLYLDDLDHQEALPKLEERAYHICMQIPKLIPQMKVVMQEIRAGNLFKALKLCHRVVETETAARFSDTAA